MSDKLKGICSLILKEKPNTSNLVLQKLLYFIQAASLVYLGEPAFEDSIEAWQYGPVVPKVYYEFKYNHEALINTTPVLEEKLKKLTNVILVNLGDKTAYDLVDLTHSYSSWKEAWRLGSGMVIRNDEIVKCHKKIALMKNGFIF